MTLYLVQDFDREGREVKRTYFKNKTALNLGLEDMGLPAPEARRDVSFIILPNQIKKLNASFDYTTEDRLKYEVNKLGALLRSVKELLK